MCRKCHAQEHIEERMDNLRHDAYTHISRKQTIGYRLIDGYNMLNDDRD